jgi:hypothetical protein
MSISVFGSRYRVVARYIGERRDLDPIQNLFQLQHALDGDSVK